MTRLTSDSAINLLLEHEIAALARECKVFTGIYFLLRRKKIVYVGQSNNIYNRLARHIHGKQKDFDEFAFLEFPLEQLSQVETAYINHFRPQYNMTHTGKLKLPDGRREAGLSRGRPDHVGLDRQLAEYNRKWDKDPNGWCQMVAAKLDAKQTRP